jgi:predicted cupin superfamily sugar epimerase
MSTKTDWINYLHLKAHPEGGYFYENYRNTNEFTDNCKYSGPRNLATSIYYMLESGQVSKLHRLKSDEIWYFHLGSSLKVHVFHNSQYQVYVLGTNLAESQVLQLTIPAGAIFGAEVLNPGSFTILGCMVSPGFHFDDFELINQNYMLLNYPQYRDIIEKLT